jgi:phosphoglycolate phosphatase-like HAD superfamily hydrolase
MRFSFRDEKYITSSMKSRIAKGNLTPIEVDRMFNPTNRDVDYIQSSSAKGSAGVILQLDNALLDLTPVFGYSYAVLAGEFDKTTAAPHKVRASLGSPIRDAMSSFGWSVPKSELIEYETRLYQVIDKIMDMLPPPQVQPGAYALVDELIETGNPITVATSLPRGLAVKAMRLSGLSRVFDGRVSPDNLMTRELGREDKYFGQQFIDCCIAMRNPTILTALVDANGKNVMAAKRHGLTVIGLQGFTQDPLSMKASDKVCSGVREVSVADIEKIVKRRLSYAREGPGMKSVPIQNRNNGPPPLSTMAPPDDRPGLKDTFADEYGSDLM